MNRLISRGHEHLYIIMGHSLQALVTFVLDSYLVPLGANSRGPFHDGRTHAYVIINTGIDNYPITAHTNYFIVLAAIAVDESSLQGSTAMI